MTLRTLPCLPGSMGISEIQKQPPSPIPEPSEACEALVATVVMREGGVATWKALGLARVTQGPVMVFSHPETPQLLAEQHGITQRGKPRLRWADMQKTT